MAEDIRVERWARDAPPDETALQELLHKEHLHPYKWLNAPHDRYAAHSHGYHKVIYVVRGSITFGLPTRGEQITLHAGDRLDLPAGLTHDAVVGPQGVSCLEAHRE